VMFTSPRGPTPHESGFEQDPTGKASSRKSEDVDERTFSAKGQSPRYPFLK